MTGFPPPPPDAPAASDADAEHLKCVSPSGENAPARGNVPPSPPPDAPAASDTGAEHLKEASPSGGTAPAGWSVPPPPPPEEEAEIEVGAASGSLPVLAIVLGMLALVALSGALKLQGDLGVLSSAIVRDQGKLQDLVTERESIQKMVNQYKAYEEELEQLQGTKRDLSQQESKMREELAVLRRFSQEGGVAEIQNKQNKALKTLEEGIRKIQGLTEPYLPPSRLSEDKLKQRDDYLRRYVPFYLTAKKQGATWVLMCFFAKSLYYQGDMRQTVSRDRLFNYLDQELSKNALSGLSYELLEIAYSGNRVEIITRVVQGAPGANQGKKVSYQKESWWLDSAGLIARWDIAGSESEQPKITEGYRTVTLESK